MISKNEFILKFTSIIICLFFITACGTTSTTPTAKTILKQQKVQEEKDIKIAECDVKNAPDWYLKLPDGENVVAYYPAYAEGDTIEKAKKQAIFEAQKDLAAALGAKLSQQTKEFIMQVGSDTIANDLDEVTKRVISEQSVAGYTQKELAPFTCKSKKIKVYILLEYVLGSENKILVEQIKKDKKLESDLRRSKAFTELEEEINKS